MTAYYNENDPKAAAWLRELIKEGHIADGEVDERSIWDVLPGDLAGYTQCHFFAGIGGWSYAMRLAGWPDDKPVWTGSCPCQPFSAAGQRAGFADERHLWPVWRRLISAAKPKTVYGEQVASSEVIGSQLEASFVVAVQAGDYAKANKLAKRLVATNGFHFHRRWVDAVHADVAAEGYAFRWAVLGAHSVGAPHIRKRLYWVADAHSGQRDRLAGSEGCERYRAQAGWIESDGGASGCGTAGRVADSDGGGSPARGETASPMGYWDSSIANGGANRPGPLDGFWRDADWLGCRDGKWRPVEPGSFPMAHRVSDCLANVLSICKVAADRIFEYAERTKADPGETVRMVRGHFHEEEGREAQRSGVRGELYAPAVLFDFMLGQEAACNRAANSSSIQKEIKETVAGAMRIMRVDGGFVQSSHRRKSNEQRFSEPANSLHELSFLLARDTQAFAETVIDAHAAINRVGMLRGYGNAIVPQVAAAFINS